MTRIVAIDPGTSCGWAVLEDGKVVASGVWNLAPGRHEGGGMRFLRCRRYLRELLDSLGPVDALAYEEVRRHRGVDAAHVYGGIVAVLTEESEARSLPYRGIAVGTVKKRATGKGNAGKDEMCDAFEALLGRRPTTDDEADAVFVGLVLAEELGR